VAIINQSCVPDIDKPKAKYFSISQQGAIEIPINFPWIDNIGVGYGCKIIRPIGAKKTTIGVEM